MNYSRIDGLQSAHKPHAKVSMVQMPGSHWTTTPLYFSGAYLDASMKHFCLGLIVLLTIIGAQALA